MTPRAVMAELFGKATGCSHGKGGSMHLFDMALHFMGGHGIVGGQIPLGAGFAFAAKYRKTDQVSLTYFGEAAVNIGSFHEALNIAGLWKLPAIFVIENNGYGMGTAVKRAAAVPDLSQHAASYAMPGVVVDGQDVVAVQRERSTRPSTRARAGDGPTLSRSAPSATSAIRCPTRRAAPTASRKSSRANASATRFVMLETRMRDLGLLDDAELAAMEAAVKAAIDDAVKFAEESPEPDPSELLTDVYAPEGR